MAIKLFAHILRGSTAGDGRDDAAAKTSTDGWRWAFHDLVVRRVDLAAWGLARPLPAGRGAHARREPRPEQLWPDTQPWCHE
jgi:hypothetical protein